MNKISLTASMRSSLLSLQQTGTLLGTTQERLSTGKKVNSAIDNPSNFYTARSLNNRANDLNHLLDSMGQAVSTIKAASEALESGIIFLEQATAVANQALSETKPEPMKSQVKLEDNVAELEKAGYTLITSDMGIDEIQELFNTDDAKIALAEDIDFSGEYLSIDGSNIIFNGGGHRFISDSFEVYGSDCTISNIELESTYTDVWGVTVLYSEAENITINNVRIINHNAGTYQTGIYLEYGGKLENVDIEITNSENCQIYGVESYGDVELSGVTMKLSTRSDGVMVGVDAHEYTVSLNGVSIESSGGMAFGVYNAESIEGATTTPSVGTGGKESLPASWFDGEANTKAIVAQLGTSALAAKATTQFYVGDKYDAEFGQGTWYLPSMGELMDMYGYDYSQITDAYGTSGAGQTAAEKNIDDINTALTTLKNKGVAAEAMSVFLWSSSEDSSGNSWYLSTNVGYRYDDFKNSNYGVRSFQLVENCFNPSLLSAGAGGSGSETAPKIGDVLYTDKTWGAAGDYSSSNGKTVAGVVVSVGDDGSVKIVNLKNLTFSSYDQENNFNADNPYGGSQTNTRWSTGDRMYENINALEDVSDLKFNTLMFPEKTVSVEDVNNAFATLNATSFQNQYNEVLAQYNSLVKDASYKGINLLQGQDLGVKFNEQGTSSLQISGKNVSAENLGIDIAQWNTADDIASSLENMRNAIINLRNFSSELGNNYSIVQSRESFTESLINVLTEGADKLTLADMNEESANMLALQTRQQLAINSLSLASQASQAVLKLF